VIALDTNILIRFLLRDDEKQAQAVYRIFQTAEERGEILFVPLLVVLETLWVMDSVYRISRREILLILEDLLLLPILKFEQQPVIREFLSTAIDNKVDLSDLLIAHSAKYSGCQKVLTFDKKTANCQMFTLLAQ